MLLRSLVQYAPTTIHPRKDILSDMYLYKKKSILYLKTDILVPSVSIVVFNC